MERKYVETLITDKEIVDKIMAEHDKTVTTVTTAKDLEITNRDGLLKTANDTIKGFEGVDVADMQGKIQKYQEDLTAAQTAHATELQAIRFNHALESHLVGAKAKNITAVKALLKTDGLKLSDDGKIIGFDDVLKPIATENPYLFYTEEEQKKVGKPNSKPLGNEPPDGVKPGAGEETSFGAELAKKKAAKTPTKTVADIDPWAVAQ